MERQLVVFRLGGEYFGVDIFAVERIIEMPSIAFVPHAPPFIKGVTNLYDVVLPVMDLRKRFDLPRSEVSRETRLVVVEVAGVKVGMLVDAMAEVLRIDDRDIDPPPDMVLTPVNVAYIAGIAKVAEETLVEVGKSETASGRLVIVLNLAEVLSTKERGVLRAFEQSLEATSLEDLEGVEL